VLKHDIYYTAKNLGVDPSVMWGDFFPVKALAERCQKAAANP
jgi:hypothetical protein